MIIEKINGIEIIGCHSGYTPGIQQWVDFLNCWSIDHEALRCKNLSEKGYDLFSAINIKNTSDDIRSCSNDALDQLVEAEKRLGVNLPQSYKDFVIAFGLARMVCQEAVTDQNIIGMFSPSRIRRLAESDPLVNSLVLKTPFTSPDEDYFVYGVKQDFVGARRAHFWSDSILVGMYGDAMFERIVLYPQVITEDGEMEASMGFHASEFRAPSFAELMRQLSYMETHDVVDVAPYAQSELDGSCADKLPLKNVWWD